MSEALPPIVETIEIARPMEAVWRVLTYETPNWLGCMRYQREVGHVFFMQQDQAKAARDDVSGATQCEILALETERLFKFSWFVPDHPATFVSFALEPVGERATRVMFMHEGWERFPAEDVRAIRDMLAGGWRSHVLPGLKRAAEA